MVCMTEVAVSAVKNTACKRLDCEPIIASSARGAYRVPIDSLLCASIRHIRPERMTGHAK